MTADQFQLVVAIALGAGLCFLIGWITGALDGYDRGVAAARDSDKGGPPDAVA